MNKKIILALIIPPLVVLIWSIILFSLQDQPAINGYLPSISNHVGLIIIILSLLFDSLACLNSKNAVSNFFKLAFASMAGFVITMFIFFFISFATLLS